MKIEIDYNPQNRVPKGRCVVTKPSGENVLLLDSTDSQMYTPANILFLRGVLQALHSSGESGVILKVNSQDFFNGMHAPLIEEFEK